MRILITGLYLVFSTIAYSQIKNDIRTFTKKNNGIEVVASDSLFSCQFQFRIQNRMGYESKTESDFTPETFEFRVRRLRLKMAGFVYNPKWTYKIQLAFSRGDMDWEGNRASNINTNPNVIRDAVINYQFSKSLGISLGQTKLPGNRQRVVSSGDQQFVDRSIVNSTLTIDRDFGVFINYEKSIFKVKAAVTSGEGRNSSRSNKGLSYTGRLEILPLGKFTGKNDYIEGDLEREKKPKISIGATYNYNAQAVRTGGQLGEDLLQSSNIQNAHLDLLFKYKGIAFYNEYCIRISDNPISSNSSQTGFTTIFNGYGNLTQLSYLFKNNFEIAARYAFINPYSSIFLNPNYPTININRQDQIHLGATKYISGHRLKLQGNLTYNTRTNMRDNSKSGKFGVLFQIEFGI